MIRLAVFGQPVKQSLSPRIHRLFAEQAGLVVDYRAIECPPGGLGEALETLAERGGRGCNVTLPLKQEAMTLAELRSERVELAGAANTLTRTETGWSAENTDGTGLVADLLRLGLDPAGRRVALIGAGGAAAGVTAALLAAKPATLAIFNRTAERARDLANRHRHLGPVTGHGLDALASERFDLVLNATSQGHAGGLPPVHPDLFETDAHLYDLNYGPAAHPLQAWAQDHDIPYSPGIGMLVGQAAESFRIWTGVEPELEVVIEALVG